MAVKSNEATQTVTVAPAKGRPMLSWVGKKPLGALSSRPAQHVETFDPSGELSNTPANPARWADWPATFPTGGLLLYGDNKEVLASLIAQGFRSKVKLIYIDPPFDSGADYVRKVQLRGIASATALEGDGQSLIEQVQYADIWANDAYLQFMYERLLLLRELLADDGSIYVHCDYRRSHHLRCILDEVFGENIANEIVWCYTRPSRVTDFFPRVHDNILFYSKSGRRTFKPDRIGIPYDDETVARSYRGAGEESAMGTAQGSDRLREGGKVPEDHWFDIGAKDGDNSWRIPILQGNALERTDYPTQKPRKLLARVIEASSNPGDIVLDCFIGSGTTAEVAQMLGRRWIGCDINKGAIQTTSRRIQNIIRAQITNEPDARQETLIEGEDKGEAATAPAQRSFTLWRVNDYDLQIQHNEAVALVSAQLGIERTKADRFFDGTLGSKLVKVVPFDHPLGPLDLEAVKQEIEVRGSEETRSIVMVCLGKQLAADGWLANWNKFRAVEKLESGTNVPVEFVNKIEVMDLRSDPKYGGFIAHEPAQAHVRVERKDGDVVVIVEDFISPTIIKRLDLDMGLFRAQITDWRAMVNSIEIDTEYNGDVLNITSSDIPEKKSDLVRGVYRLSAPAGATTVAVKITDMLGEEVLITEQV